ncbi:MAG: aminotransferase, partial [Opitutae bacterium]|nr:aminotransferase [Opitutae bacterium]
STDILVEQLICTGHGMNAVEGFASGIPVVSNLEDDDCTTMFRRWSFLNECPIASASPESIVNVLRKLVTRPALRSQLGIAGRQYAEKYLGLDSAQYLFGEVIDFLYGRRDSLINLYHPLLGDYPKHKPFVEHPLVNNQIVD